MADLVEYELPENLKALFIDAFTFQESGDWEACVRACTEFLNLAEKEAVPAAVKAEIHIVLGSAYWGNDDLNRANAHYNKAVELDPQNFIAYHSRASFHADQGNFEKSLKDFHSAVACVPEWDTVDAPCYIASKVLDADDFEHLFRIWRIVIDIKEGLLYPPTEASKPVFHYTELNTLKKLVEGEKFRLYNADYMNDPEEGKIFWNIIKKISGRDFREKIDSVIKVGETPSPIYIGSFVRMKNEATEDDMRDGELFLWRTYGKNAGVEAAGACLHFDISKFSESPPSEIGRMRSTGERIYEVVYENELNPCQHEDLQARLEQLIDELTYITEKEWASMDAQKNAFRLTGELLDGVSFLFKAKHYQEERELRIVQSRYTVYPVQLNESDATSDVKADGDHLPPRFYLEAKNLELKEITLGPRTESVLEWFYWLMWKKSGLTAYQSRISYGKKNQ